MHYVKQFDINGVATKQVTCIELHGKPNAATEGCVGVLGIDVDSPLHDVYKCVAVNGSIYSWELLSSGLSIMSSKDTGGGNESYNFPYANLRTPAMYVVKIGDLILDKEGYLYQIDALDTTYCVAKYCGTQVVAYGMSAYALAVENGFEGTLEDWFESLRGERGERGFSPYAGENGHWWLNGVDTGVNVYPDDATRIALGTYDGTGAKSKTLTFDFTPKIVFISDSKSSSPIGFLLNGCSDGLVIGIADNYVVNLTWGENDVTLAIDDDSNRFNTKGKTYKYCAISSREMEL